MRIFRKPALALALLCLAWCSTFSHAVADNKLLSEEQVVGNWYKLMLELVRHTATYSPPVAARAFSYIGIAAYEAQASGDPKLVTLAGQLNQLTPVPSREKGKKYDDAVVLNAALTHTIETLFSNTGPTGQRALAAMTRSMREKARTGVPGKIAQRSEAYGLKVSEHILKWAEKDGGAVIENMGFPREYALTEGPAHWIPTSKIGQQQLPLLPDWGKVRTFATPNGATCGLPSPPAYSEDKASDFYKEAEEVFKTVNNLTDEQRNIARFWSDDPMLSSTPPGHWVKLATLVLDEQNAPIDKRLRVLTRLGITLADAFVGCWDAKFKFDLVRPITYIKRTMDPKWEALLITPPFPEYPSGHSTQSGAAAVVLAHEFGENYAFDDPSHEDDGMPARHFASFWAAAEEAGISRLYGGIHFRSAITQGLEQGRCIGAYANKLNMGN